MDSLDLRLAPMAGVTNAPFRLVCRECGAGPLTSEEIDARALVLGNDKTATLARYLPEERPLAMQLLGADPDVLAEAARRLEAGGADAIDLNMGCPVPKIVAKGQGAALMRDPLAAAVVFRTLRKAVTGSFTIKIRGGWDERTLNAVEIARLAESEGVEAITVHPRTRSQQFTGRAPWEVIAAVVAAVRVPVVGNGDVRSVDDAHAMVAATGCAAVMIGRGALGVPWIFRGAAVTHLYNAMSALHHRAPGVVGAALADDRVTVMLIADGIHVHPAALNLALRSKGPERLALVQLKKHLAWYSTGRPGSAALRPRLFAAATPAEVRELFWSSW